MTRQVTLWDEVDQEIGYTPDPLEQQKRENKAAFDFMRPRTKKQSKTAPLDADTLHRNAFKKATR